MVWAALAAAIPAVISLIKGWKQSSDAKKMAQGNFRPNVDTTAQQQKLVDFYEKQAAYGLAPSSMAWQLEQSNQGLTSSLNAMLKAGGDPNMASGIYAEYGNNIGKTTLMDNDLMWTKAEAVGGAMQQLANAYTTDFLYNKDAKFKDVAQLSSAMLQSGQQEQSQALSDIAAVGLNATLDPYATPKDPAITKAQKLAGNQGITTGAMNTATTAGNLAGGTMGGFRIPSYITTGSMTGGGTAVTNSYQTGLRAALRGIYNPTGYTNAYGE